MEPIPQELRDPNSGEPLLLQGEKVEQCTGGQLQFAKDGKAYQRAERVTCTTHRLRWISEKVHYQLTFDQASTIEVKSETRFRPSLKSAPLTRSQKLVFNSSPPTVFKFPSSDEKHLSELLQKCRTSMHHKAWVHTGFRPAESSFASFHFGLLAEQGQVAGKLRDGFANFNTFKNNIDELLVAAQTFRDRMPDSDLRVLNERFGLHEKLISSAVSGTKNFASQLKHDVGLFLDEIFRKNPERILSLGLSSEMVTMHDAFCLFSRSRGTDPVSAEEFHTAALGAAKIFDWMSVVNLKDGYVQIIDLGLSSREDRMDRLAKLIEAKPEQCITSFDWAREENLPHLIANTQLTDAEQREFIVRDDCEFGRVFYWNTYLTG